MAAILSGVSTAVSLKIMTLDVIMDGLLQMCTAAWVEDHYTNTHNNKALLPSL